MAYFPGTQALRQSYPRKRTRQGGDNRRAMNAYGLPNLQARGMQLPSAGMNPLAGPAPFRASMRPPPGGGYTTDQQFMPGGKPPPAGGYTTDQQHTGGGDPNGEYMGANPNKFLGGGDDRNPLKHLDWWKNAGWTWRPKVDRFVWTGKGDRPTPGPNPDDEPPPPKPDPWKDFDWNALFDGPEPDWTKVLQQLGLPLDPMFEGQRSQLQSMLDMAKTQYENNYNQGVADVNLQDLLSNRALDEDMAARGIFNSGIERRGERLLGNDKARSLLGLLSQRDTGMLGAKQDYRLGIMQALMELASRSLQDPYSPIPTRRN